MNDGGQGLGILKFMNPWGQGGVRGWMGGEERALWMLSLEKLIGCIQES